jgi:hypothetical protein
MRHALLMLCLVLLGLPHSALAGVVYEGFDYPVGSSLAGQSGGSGWAGAWTTPGGADLTIGTGLSFGGLATSPGSAVSAPYAPPNMGSSVSYFTRNTASTYGADNTTTYFSFLLRPEAGFGFYGGINIGNLFIGRSGNQADYGLEGPTNDISLSNVPVAVDTTVLLVLRADFLPGNDRLSLYVNPTPGGPEPSTPDVIKTNLDVGTINSVVINNYGGWLTDDIRIGSTFASVTPLAAVPEPSALVLLATTLPGLALTLLHPSRRRCPRCST